MSVERTAMYAAFEGSPGDLAGYGAMADLLDADGWAKLSHSFRWMCFRGIWPHKRHHYCTLPSGRPGRAVPKKFRWAWYAEKSWQPDIKFALPHTQRKLHALPDLLISGDQKVFETHQQAVMFLADGLALLGQTYRWEIQPTGLPLHEVLPVHDIRVPPDFSDPEGDG